MRLRFRTKIFLGLLLTVAVLLGGALLAAERGFGSAVETLVERRVAAAIHHFEAVERNDERWMAGIGEDFARATRFNLALEDPETYADAGPHAAVELQLRNLGNRLDALAIADRHGTVIARLVPSGDKFVPGDPGIPAGEPELLKRAIESAAPARSVLVRGATAYRAVAIPVVPQETLLGVVVFSRSLASVVAEIQALQDPEDDSGFVVDGTLVGARRRFPPPLAGRSSARVDGSPFEIVVKAAPTASPAVFVGTRALEDARNRLRLLLLTVAGGALLLSVVVSSLISSGISRPVLKLVEGTRRVADGAYGHRVDAGSRDELGDLARAFNTMAGDLETKEKVRAVLNKVVAREVADELLKGDLGLGGRLVRATLLFADLRGFTAMTQGMPPVDVVAMLNEYMTLMSREIVHAKGIVDKYVGDEIIGVFGAPKSHGNDSLAAVEAAHQMRRRLGELNEKRAARGEKPLAMGVGIHTGEVVAGCMGSQDLMSYTCIGAAMNLAARLCSAAKPGQVLVSGDVQKDVGSAAELRPLAPIQVKGFDQPIPVFEVVGVGTGETARRQALEAKP